jgi:hypothetical protein
VSKAGSFVKKRARKFQLGLKQILFEVATGLLTSFILNWLTTQGYIPGNIALIINIVLILGNILLIKSMWSWGIFYTIGWLIGSVFFYEFGLLNVLNIVIYIVLPVAVSVLRLINWIRGR